MTRSKFVLICALFEMRSNLILPINNIKCRLHEWKKWRVFDTGLFLFPLHKRLIPWRMNICAVEQQRASFCRWTSDFEAIRLIFDQLNFDAKGDNCGISKVTQKSLSGGINDASGKTFPYTTKPFFATFKNLRILKRKMQNKVHQCRHSFENSSYKTFESSIEWIEIALYLVDCDA